MSSGEIKGLLCPPLPFPPPNFFTSSWMLEMFYVRKMTSDKEK
jgi:hypothetical protein